MRNCIPSELFNQVPIPPEVVVDQDLSAFIRESAYKLPSVGDVVVLKELWHTACDFAERTGALVETVGGYTGTTNDDNDADFVAEDRPISFTPQHGRFLRLVGADTDLSKIKLIEPGKVWFTDIANHKIHYSVVPNMSDATATDGKWTPKLPKWFLEKYSKVLYNGMMMRVYALKGDLNNARMHANAYANLVISESQGLITSGMKKNIRVDVDTFLVQGSFSQVARGA